MTRANIINGRYCCDWCLPNPPKIETPDYPIRTKCPYCGKLLDNPLEASDGNLTYSEPKTTAE